MAMNLMIGGRNVRNVKVLFALAGCLLFAQVDTVSASTTTLPSNVQLVGDSQGLISIPEDEPFLIKMGMLPGDRVERTMIIQNDYEYAYDLFLRAERVSEKEEYDLLTKLELSVYDGDQLIYEGPASGEDGMIKDISLGTYEPGETTELYAVVELDGPSTGNEYKNKYAEVNWIFTAVRAEESEKNPVKPEAPVTPNKPNSSTPTKPSSPTTGYAMSGIALVAAVGCIGVGVRTYVKRGKDE